MVMEKREGRWCIVVKHNTALPADSSERNARLTTLMQQE
jgi:hypothetical protein